jgi:hypothetical protein
MKSIIKLTFASFAILVASHSYAQKKVTETKLKVDGVCFMCKNRIESALDTAGVKFAEWDIDTQILKIAFRNDKYTISDISQIMANVGHDTEEIKATDAVYSKIDMCCKYRDEAVREDHGLKKHH